ncbi:pyridoxamine 5'-phosphate oxidase [soil metagenome]
MTANQSTPKPLVKFEKWYREDIASSEDRIPSACCLSTTGLDGYPNARFVSLKEVTQNSFIITGPLNSRKGTEVNQNPRAALTFWWPSIEKQVRVQGDVSQIDQSTADHYFSERTRESQILSSVSKQGKPLKNIQWLENRFDQFSEKYSSKVIPRPDFWGGLEITPVRIEFLAFKNTRFHQRQLYSKTSDTWIMQELQP